MERVGVVRVIRQYGAVDGLGLVELAGLLMLETGFKRAAMIGRSRSLRRDGIGHVQLHGSGIGPETGKDYIKGFRINIRSVMNSFEQSQFLDRVHQGVDVVQNLDILYAGACVGDLEFLSLYRTCMQQTRTGVGAWKAFRRAQRALTLARYFHYALSVDGARVECGVLRGFTALMLAKVAGHRNQEFDGAGFHLVDSFEGLSAPTAGDQIGIERLPNGEDRPVFPHQAGHLAASLEQVRSVFTDFPNTDFHKGWIPDVFAGLPETEWSFVHIDVDLYEPTKACIEYFLPRLAPGGVIVNDDFASPLFPGGGRGWKEVMDQRALSYVVLDTGQSVYLKPHVH